MLSGWRPFILYDRPQAALAILFPSYESPVQSTTHDVHHWHARDVASAIYHSICILISPVRSLATNATSGGIFHLTHEHQNAYRYVMCVIALVAALSRHGSRQKSHNSWVTFPEYAFHACRCRKHRAPSHAATLPSLCAPFQTTFVHASIIQ